MTIEVREIAVPAAYDDGSPEWATFADMVEVRNAVMRHLWDGDATHDITTREAYGTASSQEDERIVYLGGWLDGVLVARGYVELSRHEALHIAGVDVLVVPEARRRGVGTAVWREIERILDADGRTTVQAWVDHRPAGGPALDAPTGFGSVPRDAAEVRFLLGLGFRLEQIERMSELRLDEARDALERLREEARAHAHGYAVRTWAGRTPPELLDDLAVLHQRMSTDAPAAGLEHEEEVWDAGRVERVEDVEERRGRQMLRAVAIHEATGHVVAFTTLVVASPERPVYQHDTLVHAEHRGHRLGMLVKVANLLALADRIPLGARVHTWNAEENRPMLGVNEALGFRAIGYEGAWQLVRDGAR
ncbi:GNAT family N-acetyltransferase [Agrococcus sp. SGAir0287]|uniref:GNAT family N-acetyltransferase n=1 Tax=Agrococcus sp. SGAir0287 TaxID=2070347 RepID=UPI0010CD0CA3|nr:GNAT family N-acetyltransferase [Agrococcus sp. SGAir0287]QCR18964.1 N-acetyltransferase [Agrococcus sp. SGAir0287]